MIDRCEIPSLIEQAKVVKAIRPEVFIEVAEMVDRYREDLKDLVVALWSGAPGGIRTWEQTLVRARSIGKEPPKWTTERPKSSGFYWVFEPRLRRPPTMAELFALDDQWSATVVGTDQTCFADDFDPAALWCGPVLPPEVPR